MVLRKLPMILSLLLILLLLLTGCGPAAEQQVDIAATTGPVAQFAGAIVEGSGLTVAQVVTDSVSCLHDYSLSVRQMEVVEKSRVVLLSGAGLEAFLEDALQTVDAVVDASAGIELLEACHDHDRGHDHDHGHDHEADPHIWLDPARAARMAENLCAGLTQVYPEHAALFRANTEILKTRLLELQAYGQQELAGLSCRKLITFHDGFGYLADAFGLEILAAIEEESGSEASAADLIEMVGLVRSHSLPAIFTEINGSPSAASVIHAETGAVVFSLDMAMGGSDYFAAMEANIHTLKEALQ